MTAWGAPGRALCGWRSAAAALAAMLLLVIFPKIDLVVSGWFYAPGRGFALRDLPFFIFVMKAMPDVLITVAVMLAAIGLAGAIAGRAWLGITWRVGAFAGLTMLIGPGLLVNTLFKDHWGRARPHQIIEFGGTAHFSPAVLISDQCARNCSFPAGHPALGFWLVALAFLAPPVWRGGAVAAALVFGALVGVMRIAQGGHFLSDVLASAIIVIGVNCLAKRLILRAD